LVPDIPDIPDIPDVPDVADVPWEAGRRPPRIREGISGPIAGTQSGSRTGPRVAPAYALPDSVVFDAWVLDDGSMLDSLAEGAEVTAFDIDDAGHALVYLRDTKTGALNQARAFALYGVGSWATARETSTSWA
jgi:hypothetical protein